MLNFCQRFYNRQFITRKLVNSDMLMKFDQLLRDYYEEKIRVRLRFLKPMQVSRLINHILRRSIFRNINKEQST
jgi:hypothetical protein